MRGGGHGIEALLDEAADAPLHAVEGLGRAADLLRPFLGQRGRRRVAAQPIRRSRESGQRPRHPPRDEQRQKAEPDRQRCQGQAQMNEAVVRRTVIVQNGEQVDVAGVEDDAHLNALGIGRRTAVTAALRPPAVVPSALHRPVRRLVRAAGDGDPLRHQRRHRGPQAIRHPAVEPAVLEFGRWLAFVPAHVQPGPVDGTRAARTQLGWQAGDQQRRIGDTLLRLVGAAARRLAEGPTQ